MLSTKKHATLAITAVAVVAFGGWAIADGWGLAWFRSETLEQATPVDTSPSGKDAPVTPATHAAAPTITGKGHPKADEHLTRVLHHLHKDALDHFYSDPRNGLARMPPVFEKIVREWKPIWISPGEFDSDAANPHRADLERIHAASLNHYLDPKPLAPIPTFRGMRWDAKGPLPPKTHWEAKNVDLIGLVKHDEPTAYVSEKVPDMKKLAEYPTRPLDLFEVAGLERLAKGEDIFVRSSDAAIRMLGAVRASKSCLECHSGAKEGDMFGAFSYTLRPAAYEARPWSRRIEKDSKTP